VEDNEAIQPVIEEFEELCRNYLELEELVKAPLTRKYPPEYDVRGLGTEQAAESVALEERNRLALGDGPIRQLRDVLENDVGVRIFFLVMPHAFAEIYRYDEVLGACMCINMAHPEDRQRWSMGHGYAHFLAHRHNPEELYDAGSGFQRKPESERFADYFAKHFLMPSSGLVRRFNDLRRTKEQVGERITTADLLTFGHYYGVSFAALMDRLEMGLVPPGTGERMRRRGLRVREAQELLGFAPQKRDAQRLPGRYQHLAFLALEKGLITEGRFARFLGVSLIEARQAAQLLSSQLEGLTHSMVVEDNSQVPRQDQTDDREV
jgi:Zn-dependent peptidase ImmA (M78 family)